MKFTAAQIAVILEGEVEGNPEIEVSKLSKIEEGGPESLSFLANPKYTQFIYTTKASIVIVNKIFKAEKKIHSTLIRVEDAYKSFSKLLEYYNQVKMNKTGIESPVFISKSAIYGENIYIGAFAYLGENIKIGNNTKIYPNVYIGDNVVIGDNVILFSGAKIYSDTLIGDNCVIHSCAILGADGFGFAPNEKGEFIKVPQTGNVVIEDNVDVGAATSIDRATLGSTIIRKGVKLDNHIQIAHNVEIGKNTVIAAQTGVAGSTKIGESCIIGGQVGFVGHIEIANGTKVQAQSGVAKSVKKEKTAIYGSPAISYANYLRSYAVFKNLPELSKKVNLLKNK